MGEISRQNVISSRRENAYVTGLTKGKVVMVAHLVFSLRRYKTLVIFFGNRILNASDKPKVDTSITVQRR